MTPHIVATAAVAISLAVLVNAQAPTQTTQPKTLRLTGCLASVTAPGGGALPNNAVLNNAVSAMSGDEHAKVTPRTVANKPKPVSYELSAAPSVGLAKHIGHKVEVLGTITPSPHGNPDIVPLQGGKHGLREHVTVTSLTHVAAKCP